MTTNHKPHSKKWAIPFFTLWTGQSLSLLGSNVARFAVIWWITLQTGSAVTLTTLALFAFVPQIVLGPFAGALVDRWDRRRVMMIADGSAAIAAAALGYLFWADQLLIWHIYVTTFVGGLAGIFHFSAMITTTSLMVPEEHLTRVQGANQMIQGLLTVGGPPLGALALSVMPLHYIMGLDVATAAFAIAPLFFIHIPKVNQIGPEQEGTSPQSVSTVLQDVRAGFSYIWAWKGLLLLISIGMVLNMLINPILTVLPILVTGHFGGGVSQLAWIEAAFGLGLLGGGILLGVWGGFKRKALMLPVGLVGMAMGCFAIGFAPSNAFSTAWGGMLLFGIMNSMLNGSLMALLQTVVAPEMQGRVFTVMMSGMQATVPLGLLVAGPLVDGMGVSIGFVIAGVVMLAIGVVTPMIRPLMTIDEYQPDTEKDAGKDTETALPVPSELLTNVA